MILVDYPHSETSKLIERGEIQDENIVKPKPISNLKSEIHNLLNREDINDHEKSKLYNNSLSRYLHFIDQHRVKNDQLKQNDYSVVRDINDHGESLNTFMDVVSDDNYEDIDKVKLPKKRKRQTVDDIITRLQAKYVKNNRFEIQRVNKLKKKAIDTIRNNRIIANNEREKKERLMHNKDLAKRNYFRRIERDRNKKRNNKVEIEAGPSKKQSSLRVLYENIQPGRIDRRRRSKDTAVKKLADFYSRTRKAYNRIAKELEQEKARELADGRTTLAEMLEAEELQKRLDKKRPYREHKKIDGTNNDKGLLDSKRLRGSLFLKRKKRLQKRLPLSKSQKSKIKNWVELDSIDLTNDDDDDW